MNHSIPEFLQLKMFFVLAFPLWQKITKNPLEKGIFRALFGGFP
jgi:hypothetical protein